MESVLLRYNIMHGVRLR